MSDALLTHVRSLHDKAFLDGKEEMAKMLFQLLEDIPRMYVVTQEQKSVIYCAEQWSICKEALKASNQKAEHLQERLDRMIEANDTLDQTICHLRDRLKTYTTLAGNGQ